MEWHISTARASQFNYDNPAKLSAALRLPLIFPVFTLAANSIRRAIPPQSLDRFSFSSPYYSQKGFSHYGN